MLEKDLLSGEYKYCCQNKTAVIGLSIMYAGYLAVVIARLQGMLHQSIEEGRHYSTLR